MTRNPFEHHHHPGSAPGSAPGSDPGHDHGHDHDHASVELDPAQQSLADALRVCFFLLKLVMLGLLVAYLFSGVFKVEQQEKAVRLFFGAIVGEPGRRELEPGRLYFSLPYPFMKVLRVKTAQQELSIDKAFWHSADPAQAGMPAQTLNPEKDGSLITGDANVIHVRWNVTYAVTHVIDYLQHVGDAETAEQLVRAVAEESIVKAVAQVTAEQVSKGDAGAEVARELAQRKLRDLHAGIDILLLTSVDPQFPQSVKDAFDAVTNADAKRAQQISDAQKERSRILQEAAGGAWEPLWLLVHEYEQSLQAGDAAKASALIARLDETFDNLQVADPVSGEVRKIGGAVSTMMYDAHSFRSSVVQQITAKVNTFTRLREQWQQNRRVLEEKYLAEARREILGNARETFWTPGRGQVYLDLNRDPNIEKEQERRRLTEEQRARTGGQ